MAEIGIFVGTMYGNALLVAEEAEAILTAQGHKATVFESRAQRLAGISGKICAGGDLNDRAGRSAG